MCVCVRVCVLPDAGLTLLSELTGLVVRGVKLRIFMFKAGLWLAGLNMRNFNRQPSNLIIPS